MGNKYKRQLLYGSSSVIFMTLLRYPLSFIARPVLIYFIGVRDMGIFSVVTAFITVFSIFESQITSTFNIPLYEPLVNHKFGILRGLSVYYKKIYFFIGLAILLISLCLMPFIPHLISQNNPNIVLNDDMIITAFVVFALSLFGLLSHFFCFIGLRPFLNADQKQYIISIYTGISNILCLIVQIPVVIITKNVIFYAFVVMISTLLSNVALYFKAKKLYSEVLSVEPVPIDKITRTNVLHNAFSGLLSVIFWLIAYSLAPIYVSLYGGLLLVVKYTNYSMIIESINGVITRVFEPFAPGIGNAKFEWNENKTYLNMRNMQFLMLTVSLFVGNILISCYQPFIKLWVGSEFLLENGFVLTIALFFAISLLFNQFVTTFLNAFGLLYKMNKIFVISIFVNIFATITMIFVLNFGVSSILLSNLLTQIFVFGIFGFRILFRDILNNNPLYKKQFIQKTFCTVAQILISYAFCYTTFCSFIPSLQLNLFNLDTALGLVSQITIYLLSSCVIATLIFMFNYKSNEFKYLISHIPLKFIKNSK